MNTDLETQLSADMARFTLGIRVPPDLARKACRRNRRRRARLRAAIASGTTAALIVAVAVAGVAGVFASTARLPIQTTAYVVKQVDKALAPANVATLIRVTRAVPVPGHKPGEFVSPSTVLGPTCTGSTTLSWTYGETWKLSAYGADGRHLFDLRTSATKSSVQETEVIYCNRTWWAGIKPRAYSGGGSGIDSPAQIRSSLSAGIYRVAGSQLVDGVKTIKLTEGPTLPSLTLWVSPVTYLPVRIISGPLQVDFQWLPPTRANLAWLGLPVPVGFKQVPPNL